ncbi:MAG: proteasome accessory factor PafA2 family protein, partial [Thermoplasmata archaeon]|nr:proteasome accessory factor PafA2 family protein [Thermoplasmata archaeon]
ARDLVVWEKAGEKIVDWLRKKVEEKYLGPEVKLWAFKNNTSPDGTSYGSHENYCVSRKLPFPEAFVRELVPHLVTRFAYTGAGDLIDRKYVLSPMVYLTSSVVSGETMHSTGVLNTRDEPHADPQRWRRLHLLVGDALMNETAILLRHFTTHGVLQLMEDEALSDVPVLADPVKDMWRNVELMNPEKWRIQLKDGSKVSPLEIQRYYLAKVETIVQTDEEQEILRLWEQTLDALEAKASEELASQVEWLDRYFVMQEAREERDAFDVEMMACKQYSEVGQDRGLYYARQEAGEMDRVVTDEEILNAVHEPPANTRAALRRRLSDEKKVVAIDWSYVVVDDGGRKRINLPDPYQTELEEELVTA